MIQFVFEAVKNIRNTFSPQNSLEKVQYSRRMATRIHIIVDDVAGVRDGRVREKANATLTVEGGSEAGQKQVD